MKLKSIALAGCAAIALGAMGTPALAAHHSAKSQEAADNAREAKITEQLNEQQTQNPGSTPNVQANADQGANQQIAQTTTQTDMNGSADSSTDPNAKNNSSTVGRAAAESSAELDKAAGVKTPVTNAELRKAVAASDVQDPAKTLATAELKTSKGDPVGEVKAVQVNPDGTAKAIQADVGGFLGMGEREVDIDASNLRYIKERNILVTDMTKPQIENLQPVNANQNQNQNQKNNTY
jgi:hypothetical protein